MLTVLVVLSFVVYRVTRFLVEDGIVRTQREWVLKKILVHWECDFEGDIQPQPLVEANGGIAKWRLKLHELLTCPYCMSIWVSAAATVYACIWWTAPQPLLMWVAAAAGAMIVWTVVED